MDWHSRQDTETINLFLEECSLLKEKDQTEYVHICLEYSANISKV